MNWVAKNIKNIMLVSGVVTLSMVWTVLAPESALKTTFGTHLNGPVAQIVVRSWGIMICLFAALLIYGAYHASVRSLVLTAAAVGKASFVALVLIYGGSLLNPNLLVTIAFDSIVVVLFVIYLWQQR